MTPPLVTKLLAQLFQQLIHEKVASVRPTRDLAYLALVSTKDEEDTKIASTNADASSMNVDSDVPASSADPRAGAEGLAAGQSVDLADRKEKSGSPSVLGKRSSDHFEEEVAQMDVDGASPTTRRTSPEAIGSDLRSLDRGGDKEDALIAQAGEDGVMEIIPEGEARKASVLKPEPEEKANPPPLPPRKTSTLETNMMFGRQQDVGEAMDNVLFQIEAALDDSKIPKPSPPPTLAGKPCSFIQSLFYGCTQQKLEFEAEEDGARLKEETFGYQLIDVTEDGHDLYDGLDAAYTPSLVEIDGKKARRQDIITQLPPIFQIQLQRVQFDRIKKQVYKCNAYMPFPQTLRLGRYLSPEGRSPEFAAKLSRSRELRSELTSLQAKLARLEQKDDDKVSHCFVCYIS